MKNTSGPKERLLMTKASAVCWMAIVLFLVPMFVLPNPCRYVLWIPYAVLLPLGMVFAHRTQQKMGREEAQNQGVQARQ